jgi:hypothetical protein
MWMMLQQEKPEDFVLATGETHPVREYVDKAFEAVAIKLRLVEPFGFFLSFICVIGGRELEKTRLLSM